MRVWLLQGKQGEDAGGLDLSLKQWLVQPENSHWTVHVRPNLGALLADGQPNPPDVIVLSVASCPPGAGLESLLTLGVGLVVATSGAHVEALRQLAEIHPLHLVPVAPSADGLGLAILCAQASLRRHLYWKGQVEHLQQRLNDRIVIERAKGILVQRLGISEEEAYKRLRMLSRRQRRQIRDIAQSLLDTQSLLMPEANGILDVPRAEERREPERPDAPREG